MRPRVPDPPQYSTRRRPASATMPRRAQWKTEEEEELRWKASLVPEHVVHPLAPFSHRGLVGTKRRDLLVSHARRIDLEARSGRLGKSEAVIAKATVRRQLAVRATLRREAERRRKEAKEGEEKDSGAGLRPRPSSAAGFLTARGVGGVENEMAQLWLQRRREKVVEQRNEARLQTAMSEWAARRAKLEEDIARRIEARRKPLRHSASAGALKFSKTIQPQLAPNPTSSITTSTATSKPTTPHPTSLWLPSEASLALAPEDDSILDAEASLWERGRGDEGKGEDGEGEVREKEEGDGGEDEDDLGIRDVEEGEGEEEDEVEKEIERLMQERGKSEEEADANRPLSRARGGGRPWSAVSTSLDTTTATGRRPISSSHKRLPVPVAIPQDPEERKRQLEARRKRRRRSSSHTRKPKLVGGYMHIRNPIPDPSKAHPALMGRKQEEEKTARGRKLEGEGEGEGKKEEVGGGGKGDGEVGDVEKVDDGTALPSHLREGDEIDVVVEEGKEEEGEEGGKKVEEEVGETTKARLEREPETFVSDTARMEMDSIREAFRKKGLLHLMPSDVALTRALVRVGTEEEHERERAVALAVAFPPKSIEAEPPQPPPPPPPSLPKTSSKTSKKKGAGGKKGSTKTGNKKSKATPTPPPLPPVPTRKPKPSYGGDLNGAISASSRQFLPAAAPSGLLVTSSLPPNPFKDEWLARHTKQKKKKGKKKGKKKR